MGLILESTLLEVVSAFVGICTLVYYIINSKLNYWKRKGVPFLNPKFPFGNFKEFILQRTSRGQVFKEIYEQAAGLPYVGVYMAWKPILFIRDPEIIKDVLVKDFGHFHDRGTNLGDEKLDPLSQHLFRLEGAKWRSLRMKLTPTFSSGKMKLMFSLMLECAQELGDVLKTPATKGEALEVKELMSKYTTDVIGSCVFGLQFNSLKDPNSEFRNMGRRIFDISFWSAIKRNIRLIAPSVALLLRLRLLDKEIETFFMNAIIDTIRYREQHGITRNDFLQLLIQLKNKGRVHDDDSELNASETAILKQLASKVEHVEFTDTLLTAQAFVFFIAGFENSSATMSYCLYELAKNPEIQEKLQKEIDAALQKSGSFTYDCIQGMAYLDKVVDETLRKYSPVIQLIRTVTQPYLIPNTSICLDKGTQIIIPVNGIHYDPLYYPNPERFDPERFSDENKAKRPHCVYLPFGDGPRMCIGTRFGLLQMKVGLSVLLSKFQFSICEKMQLKLQPDPKQLIPTPKHGMWLKISLRNEK